MSDEVKTQLRLPPELHAVIKTLAEKDRRSLNAEIVVLLEQAIATRQPADPSDPAGFSMSYDDRMKTKRS